MGLYDEEDCALAGGVSIGTVSHAADAPKDAQAYESPASNPVIEWYCELTGAGSG